MIIMALRRRLPMKEIVFWVEEELGKFSGLDDFSSKWRTEAYGRLLINLQTQSLNDEEYIALCRRTGQLQTLIERLLQLGRVQKAIIDSQAASDHELPRLTQKEEFGLLTRIYLLENAVEAALETLPKVQFGDNLAIEVAQAAE